MARCLWIVLAVFVLTCGCSKYGTTAGDCTEGARKDCTCADGEPGTRTCLADGSWSACSCDCTPDCAGKDCGPDGCGGSCGECTGCYGETDPSLCFEGRCQQVCCPATCEELRVECGVWDDGCGGALDCGTCRPGEVCREAQCIPRDPDCQDADCSAPGLPGQGPDRDGDLWGTCCDCDDRDAGVHPGRAELIYNCKDDDCDPSTPDGDIDGDGHIATARACDPGPDCDDRDPSVYPGADEICDGKDNDCDGRIDEDGCGHPDGGIPDGGGDDPPGCHNISGDYIISTNCMVNDEFEGVITQQGCLVSVRFGGFVCSGPLDASGHLDLACEGIPIECSGLVSISESFELACTGDCYARFTRVPDEPSCGRDADCPPGECCQLFVSDDGQSLETLCYWGGGTGEPNTGEDCTDVSACCTAYCHDYPGYCLGLCLEDADCPRWTAGACSGDADCDLGYLCDGATGTCTRSFRCTTIPMTIGYDDTGMPIVDTYDACTPLRRTCQLDDDCRPGEACKIYYDRDATAVELQCEVGGPGTAESGESCYPDGEDACWTGLCLFYSGGGEGFQFCSEPCLADADCGDPAVFYCATLQVNVRPGFVSYVPVCALRDP